MEVDTIVIDNKEYVILDNLTINNITYTLFSNIENSKDIRFMKTIIENNEKFYTNLENEEEFLIVLSEFNKKLNG